MLLIVNADDLGTSQEINDAVFGLMKMGLVTSASIIANAPAFEDAASRLREFPNCSFGVHLNLTVFPPLSDDKELQAILDHRGQLSRKLHRAFFTGGLRRALLGELTLQVRRAVAAGIPLSHFDSHQHIHTIPKLFPLLKMLQQRFSVRKVRSTISLLPASERMNSMRRLRKQIFRVALSRLYTTTSPEELGDFRDFHAALMTGRLPRFHSMELMVHPGTSNPTYSQEIKLLQSGWQDRLPPEVQMASYHSL